MWSSTAWLHVHPNPTSGVTRFDFKSVNGGVVRLLLHSLNSQLTEVLFAGQVAPDDYHTVEVDVAQLAAGPYFYQLLSDDSILSGKLIVIH